MTGKVPCRITVQPFCVGGKSIAGGKLHKVKSAYKYIRPEMLSDIYYSPVRAAGNKYTLTVFFYQKILLMSEILGNEPAAFHYGEPGGAHINYLRDISAVI